MSDSKVEVINDLTEDNLTGIVIDGTPYLYWFAVYKALRLTPNHARKIIKRLEEGKHFIRYLKSQLRAKYPTVYKSDIVDVRAAHAIFLTGEGYHRAIMEIRSEYMDHPEIAAAIEAKKDKMANIYTRYLRGEVLSIQDEKPALKGEVKESDDAKIKRYMAYNKVARFLGADRTTVNKVTVEMIRMNCTGEAVPFLSSLPETAFDNPPGDAFFNRQQVAKILKVSQLDLQDRLVELEWVIMSKIGYGLTRKGAKYLKQDPYVGEKRIRFDVKFGLEAIRLLKAEFEQHLLTGEFLSSGSSRGIVPRSGGE